jgi:diacylglycerol O-acyltransferase / wax synthase
MERLSGLDASFLYMETPTLHMHVSMAAVFDPKTIEGGYSFDQIRELVAARLIQMPVFRRRLVEVPFRLGHPYWVDDPSFDIDFHLRRAALPTPGGMKELGDFVGDVCSRQLDRTKPLWQMYIVEGLEDGNFALVTKIHHSTIDGVSGAELLSQLFDLTPDPRRLLPQEDKPARTRVPSDTEIVLQAIATRLTKPPKVARLAFKTVKAVISVRKVRGGESAKGKMALPLTAPRTSINGAITAHRKVGFSSISLDDVKRLKNLQGTTVNDVVLAICTGALRKYLSDREELPETPLVATVPVSVADMKNVSGSNRISAMFVGLPTEIDDPLERLDAINQGTRGAKEEHHALGADVLLNWTEHATPTVFAAAARMYSRLRLADRHRPIHTLIVSNVPGPDFPLYFAGAELVAGFPLGPVLDGSGLNITVMSYRGVLNWGFMACRETVRDVDDIALAVPVALQELMDAAGLGAATSVGVAPGSKAKKVAKSVGKTAKVATKKAAKTVKAAKTAKATSAAKPAEEAAAKVMIAERSALIAEAAVAREVSSILEVPPDMPPAPAAVTPVPASVASNGPRTLPA